MSWLWRELKTDWNKKANLVTLLRLILSPLPAGFIVAIFILRDPWLGIAAAGSYAFVAATDLLDGYLARLNDGAGITALGKWLDPAVDKVLNLMTFSALCLLYPWLIPVTCFIALRERSVTRIRNQAKRCGVTIPASVGGKKKQAAQCVAITLLTLQLPSAWFVVVLVVVVISVVLTGTSWAEYARNYRLANVEG